MKRRIYKFLSQTLEEMLSLEERKAFPANWVIKYVQKYPGCTIENTQNSQQQEAISGYL